MKHIVIMASGSGSNAQKIIEHFDRSELARVVLVLSNNKGAGVFERCDQLGVPALYFNKAAFQSTDRLLECVKGTTPDLIVLAGFLKLIPPTWIQAFPQKIINIHPALLPQYGGKGMYGMNVHREVKKNRESKTGISIHYVSERYDEGALIRQFECSLEEKDSPEEIAAKVRQLEHKHFPKVIEALLHRS